MSWDTAHCIEDMLHIINPEHYKHLKDIPTKTFQNKNYSYNKFQYALEMYIKDQKLNASDLKEVFEASPTFSRFAMARSTTSFLGSCLSRMGAKVRFSRTVL